MWIPEWVRTLVISDYEKENGNPSVIRLELIQKRNEVEKLSRVVKSQEDLLAKTRIREVIDVGLGDPVPSDKEKRKQYVDAVAGLHTDYLRPKLIQMIANGRAVLEVDDNTREDDLRVKGMLFAFWEIIRWGDTLVSEHKEWLMSQQENHGNENQGSQGSN